MEKVSKRFIQLEAELKQQGENSPRFKVSFMLLIGSSVNCNFYSQEIKKRIVREYYEMKKDLEHQRAKNRFQYLHEKLSHIKKLVSEYDQAQAGVVKC